MTFRRTVRALLLAAALLPATAAHAVGVGGTLYVRVKDAKLLEAPNLKAKALGILQPGTEVTWRGADKKNRQLHKISVKQDGAALEGYVLQANLSPRAPAPEYLMQDGDKPIDAQSFKSSGAATKALGGMALDYASAKKLTGLPEKLMALEAISASVDARAVDARARALGLAAGEEPEPEPGEAPPPKKKPVTRKKKKAGAK